MNSELYIVAARHDSDTYFLFRDNGTKIKFTVIEQKITIVGKGYFTPNELNVLKHYFSFHF